MKLIALKFRGVGPYKGEYAIDFAALTRSHMFLIDGETGAGKTTLLDCVTFALYGSISSNTENKIGVATATACARGFWKLRPTKLTCI